jgi:S-adenosylmethionine hydrolase
VKVGGDWLLGPDNGLLARVSLRDRAARAWRIGWLPQDLSASFHGRDWFAPAAARLCRGDDLGLSTLDVADLVGADWPDALPAVVYADRYGNLMCGLAAATLPARARIGAAGRVLERACTFCEVPPGEPFWYENALGLAELAVNQGRAQDLLGLAPGDGIEVLVAAEPEVDHV